MGCGNRLPAGFDSRRSEDHATAGADFCKWIARVADHHANIVTVSGYGSPFVFDGGSKGVLTGRAAGRPIHRRAWLLEGHRRKREVM